MEYTEKLKDETASRLKKLRLKEKLSFDKLENQLNGTYFKSDEGEIKRRAVFISSQESDEEGKKHIIAISTLKNYELLSSKDVSIERKSAGYGMNISYLAMFADFYKVSVEYLLGLTDIESPQIEIKGIHKETGLSEEAINALISTYTNSPNLISILSKVLANEKFNRALQYIDLADTTKTGYNNYIKYYEEAISDSASESAMDFLLSPSDDLYKPEGKIYTNIYEYINYLHYQSNRVMAEIIDEINESRDYTDNEFKDQLATRHLYNSFLGLKIKSEDKVK